MNMSYKAYYYLKSNGKSPLEEYLRKIKDIRLLIAIEVLINRLIDSGCNLPSPFIKSVTEKIYELRLSRKQNQCRIFYFLVEKKKIILLGGFTKKTNKIPTRILKNIKHYYSDYLIHKNERIYIRKNPKTS